MTVGGSALSITDTARGSMLRTFASLSRVFDVESKKVSSSDLSALQGVLGFGFVEILKETN